MNKEFFAAEVTHFHNHTNNFDRSTLAPKINVFANLQALLPYAHDGSHGLIIGEGNFTMVPANWCCDLSIFKKNVGFTNVFFYHGHTSWRFSFLSDLL